jgi:dihydroneopterin aldolase
VSAREAITLRAMRFHLRVGILPHEREHAQPIEIDVTVWRSRQGAANAETVLDYRRLYDLTALVVGLEPRYLEEIGDEIADQVMHGFGAQQVRVAVRKPNVALPGPLAHAEVVIERRRDA